MSRRISVVDLTLSQTTPLALRPSLEVSPTLSPSSIRSDRSEPYSMPRGTKRKRRQPDDSDDQSRPGTPDVTEGQIESIDLTDVTDTSSFARALAKKRPNEIQAQSPEQPDKQATLAAYQCPVCMDHLEDSTTTSCGHLFCHKCIIEYLRSIESGRSEQNKPAKGTCPVCRKPLSSKDSGTRRSLIPLKMKVISKKDRLVRPDND
ncbi:Uncharacterized protein PECH_001365 [Penicillium ucsense]|uniref:RING-type domain-containing protein n=1 Tax=Penicillium ucsense TaxID=2839758 RepID=A0A8J8W9H5_9EURO|nr:Uncharacterized protein PECM_006184 [Penicillium ucsense]KAF7739377.1 Uncharacterized protein PECH_001365 [Penicillium ucsense]